MVDQQNATLSDVRRDEADFSFLHFSPRRHPSDIRDDRFRTCRRDPDTRRPKPRRCKSCGSDDDPSRPACHPGPKRPSSKLIAPRLPVRPGRRPAPRRSPMTCRFNPFTQENRLHTLAPFLLPPSLFFFPLAFFPLWFLRVATLPQYLGRAWTTALALCGRKMVLGQ